MLSIGLVTAKDEMAHITYAYIRLVMDFDKMRKYTLGLHAYVEVVVSIMKARDTLKINTFTFQIDSHMPSKFFLWRRSRTLKLLLVKRTKKS